ncbi:MAG: serine/threonine-protein kinase [Luteimonas sp.]|nr:serine/threonine-protein kinase [Luteimonas sp.]
MDKAGEHLVLQWFERALDVSSADRRAWLDTQDLPEWLHARVARLVETESALDGFLEEPAAAVSPEGFPQLGERLGNFELIAPIDSGGMGVVYLGRRADDAFEQRVALKLIRPLHLGANLAFRRQLVARFENERALLARMTHPNIARILDGGSTTSGIPWLAMEYVDGVSLLEYCERHALDIPNRLRLFRKVCDGVQEAHRNLIVHRDLKPDNILVDGSGEPKLLDFGIARLLEGDDAGEASSLTSLTAMTPAYASPEQVRRQPTTTRSDVYSLGVMLYQLLAGDAPYKLTGLSPAEAERTICETQPRPLRIALDQAPLDDAVRQRRLSQIDGDLDRIVAKAMHKDVERRYGSAQELADDIQRRLEGRPVRAHADSATYRIGKFIGRHRLGTTLASLALAAVVSAAGVAMWQAREADRAAQDTRQVNAFLIDVLTLSDPNNTGNELTLAQVLENAGERIDEKFANRPDLASEVRHAIGYSMLSHHRLDAAAKMLEAAHRESVTAYGANDIRTLRILDGLAELRREQGRTDEAVALYLQGIEAIERGGLHNDALYPSLLNNLGLLYLIEEDYAQADPYLQRALAALDAGTDPGHPADHASLVGNLAQIAHGLEDLPRAERLYRQAQAELEAAFPEGTPDIAFVLNNRALLAEEQGQLEESLALHRQSLDVRRRSFRNDHPMVAVALTSIARLATRLGQREEALATAIEAAAIADKVYTQPHPRHASTYATLSQAHMLADDPLAAAAALRRALELEAAVEVQVPSVARYIADTRARYCARPDAEAGTCAQGSTARSPR